jgi:hypothetical protein
MEIDENTSDGYHTFKELYEMRLLLTAGFFNLLALNGGRVYRSKKHSDGTEPFGGGWFIVVAELPDVGQISFHYKLEDWELFSDVWTVNVAPEYDGHTAEDVANRLKLYLLNEARNIR